MGESPGWLTRRDGGWQVAIWAQPGAKRTEPVAVVEGELKLRLAAPPVEGKANDALLRWIAERLALPLRAVRLSAGQTSRHKRVQVDAAIDGDAIAARLGPPA